jgi:hypothetical protein
MNTPKYFFIQFGIITTLYVSVISFLNFVFAVIDDVLGTVDTYYYDAPGASMRIAVSVLVVMFPLFLWLSRLYRKQVEQSKEVADLKFRKWLLFLTLFLAGLALAIDVIVLINTFLSGEQLALGFLLKVVSVFLVALGIFTFYLADIRGVWEQETKKLNYIAKGVFVLVVMSVGFGLYLIGSPSVQRDISNDRQRQMHLEQLQSNIVSFYQAKGRLPKTIEETVDPLLGTVNVLDPETKEPYTYQMTGNLSFKLCATFKVDSIKQNPHTLTEVYPNSLVGNFEHGAGEVCFDRNIDKDRFPLNKLN